MSSEAPARRGQLLVLSARSATALDATAERLAAQTTAWVTGWKASPLLTSQTPT